MSRTRVHVAFTPPARGAAAGWTAGPGVTGVAVDVLRATTTLSVARANGAARIVPLAGPGEALALRGRDAAALACGERGGRIVPGFDLGNSPFEYGRERVAGRTLAFASTNGSQALRSLAGCDRLWLGAFVSASALLAALAGAGTIAIVCAGKLGRFALEDAAFAGWLCARLAAGGAELAGPQARLAASIAPRGPADIRSLVEGCSHARELRRTGPEYARDVEYCATLDALDAAWDA